MKVELHKCKIFDSVQNLAHGESRTVYRLWLEYSGGLVLTIDQGHVFVHQGREMLEDSELVYTRELPSYALGQAALNVLTARESVFRNIGWEQDNLPVEFLRLLPDASR